MIITWFGQSCFSFENSRGQRLVIDPFNPSIGYPAPHVTADVVTISHGHRDHNAVDQLIGTPLVKDSLETETLAGFTLRAVPTFHDGEAGALRGSNLIFVGESDGLRFVHCGDLGHELSAEQTAAIGPVDILLVPVGSVYTVDGAGAAAVVKQLNPRLTIPMHFKTPALKIGLRPVSDFLEHCSAYQEHDSNRVVITTDNIEDYVPVLVLQAPAAE